MVVVACANLSLNHCITQDSGSEEECSDETSSSAEEEEEDGEFTANEEDGKITLQLKHYSRIVFERLGEYIFWRLFVCLFTLSAEDEEETIAAQEKIEGSVNHVEELDDLAKEGRCNCDLVMLSNRLLYMCVIALKVFKLPVHLD